MSEKLSTDMILFHYTDSRTAQQILRNGRILPSPSMTYLSVNENGSFDESYPTGPKGKGWISGRSYVPNIFLTSTSFIDIDKEPFGLSSLHREYVFQVTISEIERQELRVFKNPSNEYQNIYNVPLRNSQSLKINPRNVLHVKVSKI